MRRESPDQRARRGRDLARLDLALRDLVAPLGQRAGWRAQHTGAAVHVGIDLDAGLESLSGAGHERLAAWVANAASDVADTLSSIGAGDLPQTVVHGDFAEWNVHYDAGALAGVVDFGLTHLDSRPYELAIARTYRAPEAVAAYTAEMARLGWPLTELELAAIEPVHCAFRVDMAIWEIHAGGRTGVYNVPMIERQLARTGTPPP